mgnify:CR=1 FL=1
MDMSSTPKKRLGRGLAALIGDVGEESATTGDAARKPRRLALLETTGWSAGSATAKAALEAAIARLAAQDVEVVRRSGHARLEQLETALLRVMDVSRDINAWESLWPLIPYRATDAGKLSAAMTERLLEAEKMTLADYRGWLAERTQIHSSRVLAWHALAIAHLMHGEWDDALEASETSLAISRERFTGLQHEAAKEFERVGLRSDLEREPAPR